MVREIPLTRGYVALVDDDDYERVSQFKWYAITPRAGQVYAVRSAWIDGAQKSVYLHRYLMDAVDGETVDHINGNGLDNRRANMRRASYGQNNANKRRRSDNDSGYTGVSFDTAKGRWRAQLKVSGRYLWLGYYTDPAVAALAYDVAARQHFGEFARLNFPRDGEHAA